VLNRERGEYPGREARGGRTGPGTCAVASREGRLRTELGPGMFIPSFYSCSPDAGTGKREGRCALSGPRHRRNRKRLEGLLPLMVWWAGLGLFMSKI
jgi:hypothetical protein